MNLTLPHGGLRFADDEPFFLEDDEEHEQPLTPVQRQIRDQISEQACDLPPRLLHIGISWAWRCVQIFCA